METFLPSSFSCTEIEKNFDYSIIKSLYFILKQLNLFFQNFVDVDLFLAARKIEESLRMGNPDLCLAWCHDNKTKLRKMKVC